MTNVTNRLEQLGIELPALSPAVGQYVPAVVVGNLVFASGQTPTSAGRQTIVGRVGDDVSVAAARNGARLAMLNVLSGVSAVAGALDRNCRAGGVMGYVRRGAAFS